MNVQSMLVLGSLILIGVIGLNVNSALQNTTNKVVESSAIIEALNLGERILTECRNKRFDNDSLADTTSEFTAVASLGAETGEAYSTGTFDDVDDYNNLNITQTVGGIPYRVTMQVFYVSPTELTTPLTARSYTKRINLKVKSTYMSSLTDSSLVFNFIATFQNLFDQRQVN